MSISDYKTKLVNNLGMASGKMMGLRGGAAQGLALSSSPSITQHKNETEIEHLQNENVGVKSTLCVHKLCI